MTGSLLLRGMIVGILAGLLGFFSAWWLGEPQVDRAIAFETGLDHAKGDAPEPELVSRRIQKSFGLLAGTLIYGTAIGGVFGLVFAYSYGRIGPARPRSLSAFLAVIGFLTIVLVPSLKYPANPPAVGNPDTIGVRTAAFFLMMASSVAAAIFCLQLTRRLTRRFGLWNGSLLVTGIFVVLVCLVSTLLPVFNEVPAGFPADLLWKFRIAAWGVQAVLWTALGLLFGWLTERDPRWSAQGA
jgi:hypothetical protein